MDYLRSKFPDCSITPKLHLLEDHAASFMKKWHAAAGFYWEQEIEGLHAEINGHSPHYANMRVGTERLMCLIKNHNMAVQPEAKTFSKYCEKKKRLMKKNEE